MGQSDPAVHYLSRGTRYSILFQNHEVDFVLSKRERVVLRGRPPLPVYGGLHKKGRTSAIDLLRMHLDGATADSELSGLNPLPGIVNYFSGDDPEKWHLRIPTFSRVLYSGVYPGINLVFYGDQSKLEFDFQLVPGASPSLIRLRFARTKKMSLDQSGNLNVVASHGSISFHKPVIYQLAFNGKRQPVKGRFRLFHDSSVGFVLGNYDHTRPLIIDPILDYSTYLGTVSGATAIAVDSAREAFVAGYAGAGMPTTAGVYQSNFPASGKGDQTPVGDSFYAGTAAFVAKLNSTGTALLYCTYLSGSENDAADAIAVDAAGNAYVAGATTSPDFPVTAGAFQTTNHASRAGTGFITELNSSGSGLVYSTFLGGSLGASITGLALDSSGNVLGIIYLTPLTGRDTVLINHARAK